MKDYTKFISSVTWLSIGLWILNSIIPTINIWGHEISKPLLSITSITFLVSGIFVVWNKKLWKHKSFIFWGKLFGLYSYPNLNGEWIISYQSSFKYDDKNNRYTTEGTGTATIEQSYSNLDITGVFGESSGFESFVFKLQQKNNGRWFLVYAYRNTSKDIKLIDSKHGGPHEGFCYLDINKNCRIMTGYYSNDEHRRTRGKIVFKKKSG